MKINFKATLCGYFDYYNTISAAVAYIVRMFLLLNLVLPVKYVYLKLNTPHAKLYLSMCRRIRYILFIFLYFRLKLGKNIKIIRQRFILWYFEKDTMNKWSNI